MKGNYFIVAISDGDANSFKFSFLLFFVLFTVHLKLTFCLFSAAVCQWLEDSPVNVPICGDSEQVKTPSKRRIEMESLKRKKTKVEESQEQEHTN
jgi:hypothetical protein